MNEPRDHFLAGTTFAEQEHGCIGGGHVVDDIEAAPQDRRLADERRLRLAGACRRLLGGLGLRSRRGQCTRYHPAKLVAVERLDQEIECARLHRLYAIGDGGAGGQDHGGSVGWQFPCPAHHREPVLVGHAQIRDDQVEHF